MDHNILGQLDSKTFLSEYWQTQPLLIRQAINDFNPELSAEVLAGLAMEEMVRSRIVLGEHKQTAWQCHFGPFTEDDFTTLPKTNWTLLVQDVEKHLPEYANILDYFSFLPRWRIDDLMVSYAVDGGSVGPHTDHYDVFLLQAQGQRRWQIQSNNVREDELLPDTELKILRDFNPEQEWTLNPGDMLYLPPGIAHHGTAIGECMTFSVGFRAPSQIELLQACADQFSNKNQPSIHFTDQPAAGSHRRGELDQQSLQIFQHLIEDALNDKTMMTQAIASLLTEPADTPALYETEACSLQIFIDKLSKASSLQLHPATRSLYIQENNTVQWYVNSAAYVANKSTAESVMRLVDNYCLEAKLIKPLLEDDNLIQALYNLYQNGELDIGL